MAHPVEDFVCEDCGKAVGIGQVYMAEHGATWASSQEWAKCDECLRYIPTYQEDVALIRSILELKVYILRDESKNINEYSNKLRSMAELAEKEARFLVLKATMLRDAESHFNRIALKELTEEVNCRRKNGR